MMDDDHTESPNAPCSSKDDEGATDDKVGRIPETLRKALLTGVSAVMMTEEGIRNALGDLRLPKEAAQYIIQQTERSRKDLYQGVSSELKSFLKNIDFTGELRKALTGLKLEVNAEVRFVKDDDTQSVVSAKVGDAKQTKKAKKKSSKSRKQSS